MNSKDCIKVLKKLGWVQVNQVGSHKQFKHSDIKGRVTIPSPKKDMGKGLEKSILEQMQINKEEFLKCLK